MLRSICKSYEPKTTNVISNQLHASDWSFQVRKNSVLQSNKFIHKCLYSSGGVYLS